MIGKMGRWHHVRSFDAISHRNSILAAKLRNSLWKPQQIFFHLPSERKKNKIRWEHNEKGKWVSFTFLMLPVPLP